MQFSYRSALVAHLERAAYRVRALGRCIRGVQRNLRRVARRAVGGQTRGLLEVDQCRLGGRAEHAGCVGGHVAQLAQSALELEHRVARVAVGQRGIFFIELDFAQREQLVQRAGAHNAVGGQARVLLERLNRGLGGRAEAAVRGAGQVFQFD